MQVELVYYPGTVEICAQVHVPGSGGVKYISLEELRRVTKLGDQVKHGPSLNIIELFIERKEAFKKCETTGLLLDSCLSEIGRDQITEIQKKALYEAVKIHLGRSLQALGMGAGKTFIGCAFASYYMDQIVREIVYCLLLGPSAKAEDWKKEFEQWTGKRAVIIGASKQRIHPEAGVAYYISYDLAKEHPDVPSIPWDIVVADESHGLKEQDTIRATVLVPIITRAEAVMFLSGTPQTCRPSELFTQLNTLAPSVFDSREEFARRYCRGKDDKWGEFQCDGSSHEGELNIVLKQIMFRCTTKEAVPDLPDKHRILIKHPSIKDSQPEMLRLYRKEEKLREEYKKQKNLAKDKFRANQMMNKQWIETGKLRRMTGRIKVHLYEKWLLDLILNQHPDEKIIVFAVHEYCIEYLEKMMKDAGIGYMTITGKVAVKKRQRMIDGFQDTSSEDRVSILSLGSCSDALNIATVTVVVMMEFAQAPGTMFQAEGRAHRYGSHRDVTVYYPVIPCLYDGDHLDRLMTRSVTNSKILDGNEDDKLEFERTDILAKEMCVGNIPDVSFLEEDDGGDDKKPRKKLLEKARRVVPPPWKKS